MLKREGKTLATSGLASGPQGYRPLREFLTTKLKHDAGIDCVADDKASPRLPKYAAGNSVCRRGSRMSSGAPGLEFARARLPITSPRTGIDTAFRMARR